MWGNLLLGGVVGERDTLLDVALQALDSSIKETLLLVGALLNIGTPVFAPLV
jgi:hypothetical protein